MNPKPTISLIVFLFPLYLLIALPSAMAQPGPARAQLEAFSNGLQSLQAGFDQIVLGSDGAVQDESEGRLWLQRPRKFRWEYGGDFPELLVADGSHVWIYDEILEQVTVKDQSLLSSDSPLTLLTDLSHLDEQFEVRELGADDGMQLLELQSRSPESEFERVLLGLRDNTLLLMAMEDAFGLRTEIRLRDFQFNPELAPDLFRFEPPPGTDIIGDLPGNSGTP